MITYQVAILGLKPGHSRDQALQQLATTFKQPVERLSALVASSHTVVKHGADIALAAKMQAVIEAAGFECVVEPEVGEAQAVETHIQPSSAPRASNTSVRNSLLPSADAAPANRTSTPNPITQSASVDRWALFRRVTRNFGWGHWVAAAATVIAAIAIVPITVARFASTSQTTAAAPTSAGSSADVRFSPSERLMLRLANTDWACKDGNSKDLAMGFMVTATERDGGEGGLLTIWHAKYASETVPRNHFWFWKDSINWQDYVQRAGLQDDEFGAVELTGAKNILVARMELSEDGTRLKMQDARGDSPQTANCVIVELKNSKKMKATADEEIRAMLLTKRARGAGVFSPTPSTQPPT